jgi:hypothetical protein
MVIENWPTKEPQRLVRKPKALAAKPKLGTNIIFGM